MTNATLLERIKEAIPKESGFHQTGVADRLHWNGILERHQPDTTLESRPDLWHCEGCSVEIECNSDRYRDHDIAVSWPCAEIRALAQRLGVEVE